MVCSRSCRSAPIMLALVKISCAAVVLFFGRASASTTTYIVGGGNVGWVIPAAATFFQDWASTKSFYVGDKLVFNFSTGFHDVTEVSKASYGSCSKSGIIGKPTTTGPATVTLTTAGTHYFICGVLGHCEAGQKVAIPVLAGSASPPAEAPSAGEPSAGAPPTAEGPTVEGPSVGAPFSELPAASAAGTAISTAAVGLLALLQFLFFCGDLVH